MSRKTKKHILIGTVVIIFAVVALIAIAALLTHELWKVSSERSMLRQLKTPDLQVQELSGKVTRTTSGVKDFMLNEDGEIVPGPSYGLTDGGSSICVDDVCIDASYGLGGETRSSDNTEPIKLGDNVIVRYAVSEYGKTLNCLRCSISKKYP